MHASKSQRTKDAIPVSGEPLWFTSIQLAERWQINVMTVRRWHYDGKLRGHVFSRGIIRYAAADVLKFEQEAFSR